MLTDSLSPYSSNSFKEFCVLGNILGPGVSGLEKTQFCSLKQKQKQKTLQPERRANKYTENLGQITASASSLATYPQVCFNSFTKLLRFLKHAIPFLPLYCFKKNNFILL